MPRKKKEVVVAEPNKPVKRWNKFTEERFNEFCRLLEANTFQKSCAIMKVDKHTVRDYLRNTPEAHNEYIYALQGRADNCVDRLDELMEKTLDGSVDPRAARVVADTLKWQAAKFYPKMYGERVDVNTSYDVTHKHEVRIGKVEELRKLIMGEEKKALKQLEKPKTIEAEFEEVK